MHFYWLVNAICQMILFIFEFNYLRSLNAAQSVPLQIDRDFHFFLIFLLLFSIITDKTKCIVNIGDQTVEKSTGDVWNSEKDLCLKHTCERNASGVAVETTFREYCYLTCYNVRKKKTRYFNRSNQLYLIFNVSSHATGLWFGSEKRSVLRRMRPKALHLQQPNICHRWYVEK